MGNFAGWGAGFLPGVGISAHWGDGRFFWEGNFYVVVDFDHSVFFKAKKQHIVKITPVGGGVTVKFCREENFFY